MTKQELITQNNNKIYDNSTRDITGTILHDHLADIITNLNAIAIVDTVDPPTTESNLDEGQLWINSTNNTVFVLTTNGWLQIADNDNILWTEVNNILSPKNVDTKEIHLEENTQGLTTLQIKNTNDVDNYTGSVLELKGSGADYTNNMYVGHYGDAFWVTELAGKGVMMTDKDMVIGSVTDTNVINFIIGNSYSDINTIAYLSDSGLFYTNDYSANYTNRSLVDKEYVDNKVISGVTASNGLTEVGTDIQLGGTLAQNTVIDGNSNSLTMNNLGGFYTTVVDGDETTNIIMDPDILSLQAQNTAVGSSASLGFNVMGGLDFSIYDGSNNNSISISPTKILIADAINNRGAEYVDDYSANYTDRTLVDKEYVDTHSAFWTSGSIGTNSLLTKGNNNTGGDATGSYSIAIGYNTTASGFASFTSGYSNTVSGQYSASFGQGNNISSAQSFIAGYDNVITQDSSGIIGEANTINSNYSFITGYNNEINANESAIIGGYNNKINNSHNRSVILGGTLINSDNSDTIYTQTLKTKGKRIAINTKTSNYTLDQFNEFIRIDGSLNTVDIQLPLIDTTNNGQKYIFKIKDITNACKILTNAADTFDDGTTIYTFNVIGESITIIADLSTNEWVRIN